MASDGTSSTPLLTVEPDVQTRVVNLEQEADPANRRLFARGAACNVVPLGQQNKGHPWGEDFAAYWQKYAMLLRVLLVTAVSVGARLLLDEYAWPDHAPWNKTPGAATAAGGYFDFTFVAPLFTSCMVVAGLLLSGVLSDFKEAERMPGTMSASLEAIEDALCHFFASQGDFAAAAQTRRTILRFIETFTEFLQGSSTSSLNSVLNVLSAMPYLVQTSERAVLLSPFLARVLSEISNIRAIVTRLEVVKVTDLVASGSALLEASYLALMSALVCARYSDRGAPYVAVVLLGGLHLCIVVLITEIDDPFAGGLAGSAGGKVDMGPLVFYRRRLVERMDPADWPLPVSDPSFLPSRPTPNSKKIA
jgi:hypothetical protein